MLLRSPSRSQGLVLPSAENTAKRDEGLSHFSADSAKRIQTFLFVCFEIELLLAVLECDM